MQRCIALQEVHLIIRTVSNGRCALKNATTLDIRGENLLSLLGPGDDDEDKAEDDAMEQALNDLEDDNCISSMPQPRQITREEAIAWAQKILECSRRSELKGDSNPTSDQPTLLRAVAALQAHRSRTS
jgi:hypothetical protein